jgi:hypothetical protein
MMLHHNAVCNCAVGHFSQRKTSTWSGTLEGMLTCAFAVPVSTSTLLWTLPGASSPTAAAPSTNTRPYCCLKAHATSGRGHASQRRRSGIGLAVAPSLDRLGCRLEQLFPGDCRLQYFSVCSKTLVGASSLHCAMVEYLQLSNKDGARHHDGARHLEGALQLEETLNLDGAVHLDGAPTSRWGRPLFRGRTSDRGCTTRQSATTFHPTLPNLFFLDRLGSTKLWPLSCSLGDYGL